MCEAATPLLTIDVDFEKNRGLSSGSPHSCQDVREGVHDNILLPLPCGSPRSRKVASAMTFSIRKEVIQPQVLLRLPCYDLTPIMNHTLDGCFLAVSAPASSATHFRDLTGGVYKARERIHRSILICDY